STHTQTISLHDALPILLDGEGEGRIPTLMRADRIPVDPDLREVVHRVEAEQHMLALEIGGNGKGTLIDGGSGALVQVVTLTLPRSEEHTSELQSPDHLV